LSLDLNNTASQISEMVSKKRDDLESIESRLQHMVDLLQNFDYQRYIDKKSKLPDLWAWPLLELPENPGNSISLRATPENYIAIGVDGSHIDVNRHIPIRCFLINIGVAKIEYGTTPNAELLSTPVLYYGHPQVTIPNPNEIHKDVPIEGALLGAFRTVKELEEMTKVIESNDSNIPTIGLLDGTLLLLDVLRRGIDQFVIDDLLNQRFLKALSKIKNINENKRTLLASYISLPASKEFMNSLRFYDSDSFDDPKIGQDLNYDILDRQLFSKILKENDRSELFPSSHPSVESYYSEHHLMFFYVNTGSEIARVEVPAWATLDNSNVDLIHALVLDQTNKGPTYPTVLMEAHEQAVISSKDREYFLNLIEMSMGSKNFEFYTSQKNRSKSLRWL